MKSAATDLAGDVWDACCVWAPRGFHPDVPPDSWNSCAQNTHRDESLVSDRPISPQSGRLKKKRDKYQHALLCLEDHGETAKSDMFSSSLDRVGRELWLLAISSG